MCHAKDFDSILHTASIKIGLECNIILHPQKRTEHNIQYVMIALYRLQALPGKNSYI